MWLGDGLGLMVGACNGGLAAEVRLPACQHCRQVAGARGDTCLHPTHLRCWLAASTGRPPSSLLCS